MQSRSNEELGMVAGQGETCWGKIVECGTAVAGPAHVKRAVRYFVPT
jgi:hypothetical protein